MRAFKLSLYFFALILALILGGCGLPSTSQKALPLPQVSSPAAQHAISSTPIPRLKVNASPVRLLIPAIAVSASIEMVGVTSNGNLAVPTQNPWVDVGWYGSGPRPGERGSAVIDGHVDRPGGYPAVFWRLRFIHVGDAVLVTDASRKSLRFHVTGIAFYPPQDAPIQDIFGNETGTYLNLITCAGDWIPSQHQTSLRLVVYTSLG